MIIGQNLYSNVNFQRNTKKNASFGMKVDRTKILKYAGSLGEEISNKAALKEASEEIQVLRKRAAQGNTEAAKRLAALEEAMKNGKIRGTK